MALKTPTPVGLGRALQLCWWAIAKPAAFDEEERKDSDQLHSQPDLPAKKRISVVRDSLWQSFCLATGAAVVGAVLGVGADVMFGYSEAVLTTLAIVGTGILLWATIAIKGWEIQTFSNATLTERVNRWIFRALYGIGTSILVMAVVWGALSS